VVVTGGGPEETTRATEDPVAILEPDAGLSLMTFPEGTVELDCVVTVPTVRPAARSVEVAAAWELPSTLGTVTSVVLLPPPQAAIDALTRAPNRAVHNRLPTLVITGVPRRESRPVSLRNLADRCPRARAGFDIDDLLKTEH